MNFPDVIAEKLLVACHRHCCICHKPCGTKMEIHHIVPQSKRGKETEENGIPLCFDCHADVQMYNPKHPKGRSYTSSELKRHKKQWFRICASSPWSQSLRNSQSLSITKAVVLDEKVFQSLRCDDRRPAQRITAAIFKKSKATQEKFAQQIFSLLQSTDEDTRWKAAMVIEELVLWSPNLVTPYILEKMSRDKLFSVRSSVAVCYYYMAISDPSSVPVNILSKLARYDEDWYVFTPATSALLRLTRARPVVVDIFARDLDHEDSFAREHAATAIERLSRRDWDLLPEDLIYHMLNSTDTFVKQVGEACAKRTKGRRREPLQDYSLF